MGKIQKKMIPVIQNGLSDDREKLSEYFEMFLIRMKGWFLQFNHENEALRMDIVKREFSLWHKERNNEWLSHAFKIEAFYRMQQLAFDAQKIKDFEGVYTSVYDFFRLIVSVHYQEDFYEKYGFYQSDHHEVSEKVLSLKGFWLPRRTVSVEEARRMLGLSVTWNAETRLCEAIGKNKD